MRLPSYYDIKGYDQSHETDWIGAIRRVCERHAQLAQSQVFIQFRTDWVSEGLRFAVLQTLRYAGYGYKDAMVFKDVGEVVGHMIRAFESGDEA